MKEKLLTQGTSETVIYFKMDVCILGKESIQTQNNLQHPSTNNYKPKECIIIC